jgi:hypothetical protein
VWEKQEVTIVYVDQINKQSGDEIRPMFGGGLPDLSQYYTSLDEHS